MDVELTPIDLLKRSSLKKGHCRENVPMRLYVQSVRGKASLEKPTDRHCCE